MEDLGSAISDSHLDAPLNELIQVGERYILYGAAIPAYKEQKSKILDEEEQANLKKKEESLEQAHLRLRPGAAPMAKIKQLAMVMAVAGPEVEWMDEEELALLMDEAFKDDQGGWQQVIPGCSPM